MLELYHAESCPYCVKVRVFFEENAIPYLSKPVSLRKMTPLKEELIRLGGKAQVPYLVDTDKKIQMYESLDIIEHVRTHYLKS